MTGPEMISAFNQGLLTIAAVGAFIVTMLGLGAWKKQLRGTAEWDLARRVLKQVYTVRDLLLAARNMMMSAGEMEAALAASNKPAPIRLPSDVNRDDQRGLIAGYQKRWERVQKALSDLDVEVLEAEVLWGKEAALAVDSLRDCARTFFVQLHMYLKIQSHQWENSTPEQREAIERVVFPIPGDDGVDAYATTLQKAVEASEKFLRGHVKR